MRVLIAIDGSYHSDNAIEAVLTQPWPLDCQVMLMTVAPRLHTVGGMGSIDALAARAHDALDQDIQKLLADTKDKLSAKFGEKNVSSNFREADDDVAVEIIDLATNWGADLIVMGSHGTTGYDTESLVNVIGSAFPIYVPQGGTTVKVMNHAPCSVQIINWLGSYAIEKKGKRHLPLEEARYLVPVNDSPNSRAIIDHIISRPWVPESTFQILSVIEEPKSVFHSTLFKDPVIDQAHKQIYAARKAAAEKLVAEFGGKLSAKFGKDKVTYHVLEGHVRSLICQIAQDWPADMIIIGAHDRDKSIFEHFLGSVARAVVQNADCSIEIVRLRK